MIPRFNRLSASLHGHHQLDVLLVRQDHPRGETAAVLSREKCQDLHYPTITREERVTREKHINIILLPARVNLDNIHVGDIYH